MTDLTTWRCPHCGRILGEHNGAAGSHLRIKCHSCNQFSELFVRDLVDGSLTARLARLEALAGVAATLGKA